MATQYDPTIFGYQNFFSALLTSDITSGSLTIAVDRVPSATSGILVVDPDSATNREVIFYTSKGASNVVCPSDGRGWAGTSATAHLTVHDGYYGRCCLILYWACERYTIH